MGAGERREVERADRVCPEPTWVSDAGRPASPPLFLASVYRCDDPGQAERMLAGQEEGYVYQRDRHPNSDQLADKLRRLHGADWALLTGSGMAALSVAVLSELSAGQHVVLSRQLYGRTVRLLASALARLGVAATVLETMTAATLRDALRPETRLVVVETITNPLLSVSPLPELARVLEGTAARLLVDNTLATPCVCRPLDHGADLVWESVSKMINGHSDVMLGMIAGRGDRLAAYRETLSTWGLNSSPFDCWLALRGLATLPLRCERACANAARLVEQLAGHPAVARVCYPGREQAGDAGAAERVRALFLDGMAGSMVTFELHGGLGAAERLIRACDRIPFCPSLGEVSTTLSHPLSTSHRGLTAEQQKQLGIAGGTIRLSVGTESFQEIWDALGLGLATAANAS